jgi:hypothetical protein
MELTGRDRGADYCHRHSAAFVLLKAIFGGL